MIEKEALLRSSYAAFNARDIAATLRALGPDVEWPDQLEGVTVHGPEAVGEYWRRQWAVMDPYFELKHFEFDRNGHLVVTLLQTVRGMDGAAISKGFGPARVRVRERAGAKYAHIAIVGGSGSIRPHSGACPTALYPATNFLPQVCVIAKNLVSCEENEEESKHSIS